jgi:hypothetical protein
VELSQVQQSNELRVLLPALMVASSPRVNIELVVRPKGLYTRSVGWSLTNNEI